MVDVLLTKFGSLLTDHTDKFLVDQENEAQPSNLQKGVVSTVKHLLTIDPRNLNYIAYGTAMDLICFLDNGNGLENKCS